MKLSIVIVSYNVKEYLSACITSIQRDSVPVEIIVVDNNSSDGTLQMLKESFPLVKLIANKENKGFSGANNQGIVVAESQYILLLNPDTEIVGDALEKMVQFLNQKGDNCIIGPKLLNSDRSLQISCWKFPGLMEMFLELFYLHQVFGTRNYSVEKMKNIFEPHALSGAAVLFNKDLINKIGGLDEIFFWMEDIDFCYRAKKAGANIIYFPEATIIHHSGKSSKNNQHIVISNQLISKLKFEKKHGTFFSFVIACVIIFLQIISRLFILFIASAFKMTFKEKRYAYYFSLIKYFKFISGKNNAIT